MVNQSTGIPTNDTEGSVQVFIDGKWRFWEQKGFNAAKTWVTCRELGFIRPLDYRLTYNVTEVAGNVVSNQNLECTGKEKRLIDCQHESWEFVNKTNDFYLVWVKCEPFPLTLTCDPKSIRVAPQSQYIHSGKIAIKYEGKWENLHVKHWNEELSKLACKQMGFPGFIKILGLKEYNNHNDYDNFDCQKIKDKLVCCPKKLKDRNKRPGIREAAVTCEQDIRMDNLHQAALQVYRRKSWYYACGDSWRLENNRVVCWELGYSRKSEVDHYLTTANVNDNILRYNIDCTGKESSLRECHLKYRPSFKCAHLVHVQCKGDTIRLSGFGRSHAGRIELLHKGIWGTVNSYKNSFDFKEARVVCRQLGYRDAFRHLDVSEVQDVRRGMIWAQQIKCNGTENQLQDCKWAKDSSWSPAHVRDAGVICQMNIRLVGSILKNEGKLEVFHNNSWKKVCRRHWTSTEADVVCHELGYLKAVHCNGLLSNHSNTTKEYLRRIINCTGEESKLSECISEEYTEETCADGAVEVRCEGNEGGIRLIQLSTRITGYETIVSEIQVMHQGIWGRISGDNWTLENAQVVCRQLNKPGVKKFNLHQTDEHVSSKDSIQWLNDVRCKGNERKLLDCQIGHWAELRNNGVSNWKVALECLPEIRLRSGQKTDEGRVEHYVDGQWSPVCHTQHQKPKTVTAYCQDMGYADGVEIQIANHDWNVTRCQIGKDLHIRCYAQRFRLNNIGGKSYSGLVEVLLENRWFSIFFHSLRHQLATRICNNLGYPGVLRRWSKSEEKRLMVNIPIWNETKKLYSLQGGAGGFFGGLTCKKAIRLRNEMSDSGNKSDHYGIVEIYRNEKWWRLSDNQWSKDNANVLCRYLNYDRASEIFTNLMPKKNASILFVDFKCHGNEEDLTDCIQKEQKRNTHHYARLSGVRCTVDGEEICKACECGNRSVNCNGRNLNWMPWLPVNYTAENVQAYLLAKNAIGTLSKFHLREFTYVQKLDLSNNRISHIPEDLFTYTKDLRTLDLSENYISCIAPNLFAFTEQLRYLNLSGNRIESITSEMMRNLYSLAVLDISRNKIRHFDEKLFYNLKNLKWLYTDRFTHCCYARKIIPHISCSSPADVFSSCNELLKNDFLEVFVWVVAAMVACGNLGVIFVRLKMDRRGLQTLFITSLVLSDILMSVYLLIIGYKNVVFKGRYFEEDENWRSSKSCTIAGIISLISSQVSLFMITVITTERCWSIVYAKKKFVKFGRNLSKIIVIFVWLFGSAIAIFPAVFPRYFNSKYMPFYGQNSVCLPLQLPEDDRDVLGWEYCLALFGGVNAVLCVYVTVSYIRMYVSLRQHDISNTTSRKREDAYLAKRMFGIVMTNLCCWIPVIIFTFLSLRGLTSHVKTLHAWSAVCLFPINAAINPLIYTFFVPHVKEKIKNFIHLTELQGTRV